MVKTGCQWRQLPSNFPFWKTVHEHFRAWRDSGVWERVGKTLREQGRSAKGRNATPSVVIVDLQTAKTALKGAARLRRGQEDQGPQAPHRGRHARQPAGCHRAFGWHSQDHVAARAVRMRLFCRFDSITKVFADGGYTGRLIGCAKETFGYGLEVVKRNELRKFQVRLKHWLGERTLAWLNGSRRLSKDYELCHTSAETMIHITFTHLLPGMMSLQPAIPWWVDLPQSPPPLHRPDSECVTVVLPVEIFAQTADSTLSFNSILFGCLGLWVHPAFKSMDRWVHFGQGRALGVVQEESYLSLRKRTH